jgi:hypothetical protein
MNGKFFRPAFDPADTHVPPGNIDLNELPRPKELNLTHTLKISLST